MKVTQIVLLPIIILLLAGTYSYAQPAEQPAPAVTAPPPPPQGGSAFDDERFIASIMEKVKKDDPNESQKLEQLRKDNPRMFQIEIKKLSLKYRQQMEGPRLGEPRGPMGKEMADRFHNMETELMSWLEKNEPQTAKELAALKEKDPRAYMRRLSSEAQKYREIMDAEQTNPALAAILKKDLGLKQKQNDLLEKYKAAKDQKQKKELTAQLKEVTSERFDVSLQKKQLKYEEMKKKLEELQKSVKSSQVELENYKKNKDEQIKKDLDNLINQTGQFDKN